MTSPSDFVEVRSRLGIAFAHPAIADWVRTTLSGGLTLYEAAARDPRHRPMRGRGAVYLMEVGRLQCVCRRYLRGGGMRFLGDLYLRGGTPRPQREAAASEEAVRRGIRTPRVLAWSVYPAGAFYRADLVTEFMPGSNTLAALLFDQPTPATDRREILEAAGGLISRMAAAGIHHVDLNANNILLQRSVDGYEPAALDLDRMEVNRERRSLDAAAMVARLERSIRKLEQGSSRALSEAERRFLRISATASASEGGKV